MDKTSLDVIIEAILFTAPEPLTPATLAKITGAKPTEVTTALKTLRERLVHGVRLAEAAGTVQLVTAPEAAETLSRFAQDATEADLSRPAVETLAIIAYRGPVTRAEIETIRGVSSDAMVKNLLARGLIHEAGRAQTPGRPMRYQVSHMFLQHFGLTSTADLPSVIAEAPHEN